VSESIQSEKTKVLLVDDERDFVDYMAKRLKARGMDVHVTYSGESAIETLEDRAVDVIVLDLLMPGMDGFETLQVLKKKEVDTPVIMLTGHEMIDIATEGKRYGASEYLLKPCDVATLQQAIERRAPKDPRPRGAA